MMSEDGRDLGRTESATKGGLSGRLLDSHVFRASKMARSYINATCPTSFKPGTLALTLQRVAHAGCVSGREVEVA